MKSPVTLTLASLTAAVGIVTPAFAADAVPGGGFGSLVPLILIMVIFYFLLIRPQQKRLKDHKNMVESLKKGDKIITGGGFYGTVTDVKEDELRVEIADGVRVRIKRDTVTSLSE